MRVNIVLRVADLASDLAAEREAFRVTLEQLGPEAPTACGSWTTGDLAVHMVTGEVFGGLPNAPFRFLVGRGVRLDWMAPMNARALNRYRRRRGFDWAMRRLTEPAPWIQARPGVGPVSLLEVWAHHEDILIANDAEPCSSGIDLEPVLRVVLRYQRGRLERLGATIQSPERTWFEPKAGSNEVHGSVTDLTRWLCGRGGSDHLEIVGSPEAIARIEQATFTI